MLKRTKVLAIYCGVTLLIVVVLAVVGLVLQKSGVIAGL
jgi:hypothetical protein